jgi:hypothetical protein
MKLQAITVFAVATASLSGCVNTASPGAPSPPNCPSNLVQFGSQVDERWQSDQNYAGYYLTSEQPRSVIFRSKQPAKLRTDLVRGCPAVRVTKAAYSLRELRLARDETEQGLRRFPNQRHTVSTDIERNRIVVTGLSRTEYRAAVAAGHLRPRPQVIYFFRES